jgi:hypothetical protein
MYRASCVYATTWSPAGRCCGWSGARQGEYSSPLGENVPFTESEEVWSLDASGRLLISTTTRRQNVEAKTVQTLYRRR